MESGDAYGPATMCKALRSEQLGVRRQTRYGDRTLAPPRHQIVHVQRGNVATSVGRLDSPAPRFGREAHTLFMTAVEDDPVQRHAGRSGDRRGDGSDQAHPSGGLKEFYA
jgi:hypothetical protein